MKESHHETVNAVELARLLVSGVTTRRHRGGEGGYNSGSGGHKEEGGAGEYISATGGTGH